MHASANITFDEHAAHARTWRTEVSGSQIRTQHRATEHCRSLCHTVDRQDAADIVGACAPPLTVVSTHVVVNFIVLSPSCMSPDTLLFQAIHTRSLLGKAEFFVSLLPQ